MNNTQRALPQLLQLYLSWQKRIHFEGTENLWVSWGSQSVCVQLQSVVCNQLAVQTAKMDYAHHTKDLHNVLYPKTYSYICHDKREYILKELKTYESLEAHNQFVCSSVKVVGYIWSIGHVLAVQINFTIWACRLFPNSPQNVSSKHLT